MSRDKINIYMPIELKNRDFNSRLILCLKLLEKDNFNIFFGYKGHVNYFALKHGFGIYFSLSAYKNQEKFISNLKDKSNSIVLLDEEGLITYQDDFFLRTKTSKLIYNLCDKIFVTGKSSLNRLSNYKHKKKILVTGNPRLDLLKTGYKKVYKEEIDIIKKKYKNFVLLCTTFSYINHFNDKDYINTLKKQKYLKNKKDKKLLLEDLECQKKSQKLMIDFICNYAKKLKDLNIVIRVHPSENPKPYIDLAKKFKNVYCDNNFSVHPWILASNKMLNHYCTTIIEGLTANKKVISVKPYYNSKLEINDFFEITNVAKNQYEIFKEINSSKKNAFKKVKYFAHNALGKTDSINKIVEKSIQMKKKFPKIKSDIEIKSYIIKNFFNRIKNSFNFKHNSYINHKIGNISLKDVNNFMEYFPNIKKKIFVKKVCKNFFYLTNKR